MITRDKRPISMVEDEGFLKLMEIAVPHYKVPDRKTITRYIDEYHEVLNKKTSEKLQSQKTICLSCDNWTDNTQQSYMGVTAHYVIDDVTDTKKNVWLALVWDWNRFMRGTRQIICGHHLIAS